MAKSKTKQPSLHSRAARRAEEPVDKSLQTLTDASALPKPKSKLAASALAAHDAGISKKQKQKRLTHQQRVRQERAMERADANYDKHERKVEESKRRGRKVQERRKEWEALNGDAKVKNVFASLQDNREDDVSMEPAPKGSESLASVNAETIAAVGRKPASPFSSVHQDGGEAADEDLDVAE
ncbi:oxoglutarate iron-dependent oxygenase [Diplodia corticola]|uniref:Oxoglutarate iron-dependent oxygenase n=1 Tax=Diplodia corticola TaxID=236234 RepID=A0A1J9QRX8_9PEZI|nr:oxoglutarate iron-dependent oxygenase [Diplodia corticola]OJD31208.1 oxoglutarate iron-dependent oxygenase [Diplodia corticola]